MPQRFASCKSFPPIPFKNSSHFLWSGFHVSPPPVLNQRATVFLVSSSSKRNVVRRSRDSRKARAKMSQLSNVPGFSNCAVAFSIETERSARK